MKCLLNFGVWYKIKIWSILFDDVKTELYKFLGIGKKLLSKGIWSWSCSVTQWSSRFWTETCNAFADPLGLRRNFFEVNETQTSHFESRYNFAGSCEEKRLRNFLNFKVLKKNLSKTENWGKLSISAQNFAVRDHLQITSY